MHSLESAVNVILVVSHEKLNVEMQRTYGNRITVVKIPKSGGVCTLWSLDGFCFSTHMLAQAVELDVHYRQRVHAQQLYNYFYGQVIAPPRGLSTTAVGDADFEGHLAPSSSVISFGELSFLRIGESEFELPPFRLSLLRETVGSRVVLPYPESMAPSSALPIGATRTVNEMQPISLEPSSPGSGLLNAIVALLSPPVHLEETERYDEEVLDLPVSGFLAMLVPLYLFFFAVLIED